MLINVDAKHYKIKPYSSQEEIKSLFEYDDGNLIWKKDFKYLPHLKGTIAGNVDSFGYRIIRIKGKAYKAHRLIWIYFNGEIPEGFFIDHKDQFKVNNKIDNLRLVTMSENMRNRPLFKNNSTGVEGICYVEKTGRYRARAMIDNKRYSLGSFLTLSEAESVIKRFKKGGLCVNKC